jgi:hypothetical protein
MLACRWQDYLQQNIRLLDSTSIKAGLMVSGTDSTLEISDEVLQAVLLDKTHVAMAFHKFKKESTNNQINGLYCSAAH